MRRKTDLHGQDTSREERVPARHSVAIVGNSGIGKTTFFGSGSGIIAPKIGIYLVR